MSNELAFLIKEKNNLLPNFIYFKTYHFNYILANLMANWLRRHNILRLITYL